MPFLEESFARIQWKVFIFGVAKEKRVIKYLQIFDS